MESQHSSTPGVAEDGAENPQERLGEVEAKLKEKESLVAALTQRLEQAAEQLDRLRRTGADRPGRAVGGIPPELIEEQRELAKQLQQAVNDWQEANAAAALSRIEVQVAEIREIVVGIAGGAPPRGGQGLTGALFGPDAGRRSSEKPDDKATASPEAEQDGSGLQDWEALKASLLAGEEGASSSQQAPRAESPADARDESDEPGFAASTHSSAQSEAIPEEDPPESIDVDTADVEELRAAVEARDAYIAHLLKRLRHAAAYRVPHVDWRSLENVPDELQARLEELERQLQEKLRISEVELSLERARMGREAARIQQLNEQVQKNLERVDASDARRHDESPEERKGRRWLSMLGLNNVDDDD